MEHLNGEENSKLLTRKLNSLSLLHPPCPIAPELEDKYALLFTREGLSARTSVVR